MRTLMESTLGIRRCDSPPMEQTLEGLNIVFISGKDLV
jgi:hypothetical protein